MTIHAEVITMLATLNAAFPDVTSFEPSELRALLRNRRAPLERLPDMRAVEDLAIDGPEEICRSASTARTRPPTLCRWSSSLMAEASCSVTWTAMTNSADPRRKVSALWWSPSTIVWPLSIPRRQHDDVYVALEWAAKHAQNHDAGRTGSCLPATVRVAILLRQLRSQPAIVEARRSRRKFYLSRDRRRFRHQGPTAVTGPITTTRRLTTVPTHEWQWSL